MTKKTPEKIVKNRTLTRRAQRNREHTVNAIRSHLENGSSILKPRQVTTVHRIADKYDEGSTDVDV